MLLYRAKDFGVTTKEYLCYQNNLHWEAQHSLSQAPVKTGEVQKTFLQHLERGKDGLRKCQCRLFHFLNPGMSVFMIRSFSVHISFYTVIWCTLNLSGIWLHGERIHVFAYMWFAALHGLSVKKISVKHDPAEALLQCVLVLWPAFVLFVSGKDKLCLTASVSRNQTNVHMPKPSVISLHW